jgi:hypothetical protein
MSAVKKIAAFLILEKETSQNPAQTAEGFILLNPAPKETPNAH